MIKTIIFDLDDTLIDSSRLEELRRLKQWEQLESCLHEVSILCDAKHAIESLKSRGLNIVIMTTSPKEKYALKILKYFEIDIPSENVYGYEDLKSFETDKQLPLKTFTICEVKRRFNSSNDEILFVGDSHADFMACATSNIPFITLKHSKAYDFFDKKLIFVEKDYEEIHNIIDEFNSRSYCVFKREHDHLGEFYTFAHYIKDIFNDGEVFDQKKKLTYDAMHSRIIDLKNNSMKSAVNWLYFFKNLNTSRVFEDIDLIVRALGSKECSIEHNTVKTLDLIGFYIASQINAKFMPEVLSKKRGNDPLHKSGKNREERKAVVDGNYDTSLEGEEKTILVIDDVVTTGATLEEIRRSILEQNPSSKIKFSTISQTVRYEKNFYLENMFNARFFYCGKEMFSPLEYKTFLSILGTYLFRHYDGKAKYILNSKYVTYVMDVSDIKILNKKPNKFVYCQLKLDTSGEVIHSETRLDFFDELDGCFSYTFDRTPAFVKRRIENLYNKFTLN